MLASQLKASAGWRTTVSAMSEVAVALTGAQLQWGSQDVSAHEQGAYTGEVSATMLAEFGCRYAIVGHSERRASHGEGDQVVADKAKAAL
ncbi:MAG: triose-phosphate isomerase, partial [Phycisphaerales bacterium]